MAKQSLDLRRSYREGVKNNLWKNGKSFSNVIANKLIDIHEYSRRDRPSTSSRIIAGECNGGSASVVVQPIYNTASQAYANFNDKAFMSLDGLFRPFSTAPHDTMPNFILPSSYHGPDVYALNPLNSGHDVLIASFGTVDDSGGWGMSFHDSNHTGEMPLHTGGDLPIPVVRGMGWKLPAVGVGWGLDQNGDNVTPSGDHLRDPNQFVAGPIDFRYDRDIGVWGGTKLIMGIAYDDIDPAESILTPATGTVYRYIYDMVENTGYLVSDANAYIFDSSMGTIERGTIVYYYNVDGKNHIVYAACSPDPYAIDLIESL